MAAGERSFSNYGASGEDTGTGADLFIRLGFYPQWVEVLNTSNNAYIKWNKEMPAGSGYLFGSGTATFNGIALAPHSHDLQSASSSGTFTTWRVYHGAVAGGPFQVGETVTDPFANSAVVSAVFADHIDFSSHAASPFGLGIVITGGTSGATATTQSVLVGVFTPPPGVTPFSILGAALLSTGATGNQIPITAIPNGIMLQSEVYPSCNINVSNEIECTIFDPDGGTNDDYSFYYMTPQSTSVSAGVPSGGIVSSNAGIYIASGGITGGADGFIIGNDPTLNVLGDNLVWNVGR